MESLPMNQNNFGKTMSSREIAELTGKEHKHVMRDIRALIEQGAIGQSNFGLVEYTDAKGEKRPMYLLDFNTTMTLLGRYGMSYLKAKKALVNHGLTENNAMITSIVSTPNHSNFGKSMSSREIAELTGKLHKNVIQDIRTLIEQGAIDRLNFQPISYKDSYGREQTAYELNFDATMTLLVRYGMTYDAAKKSLSKQGFKEKAVMENLPMNQSMNLGMNKTMSSREIAELTGKEHKNVLRDIRDLIEQGAIGRLNFEPSSYTNSQNKEQPEYLLDFDATMTLVTGYNAVLRAKVIRRWRELETEKYEMTPAIPKDLPTALRAYANEIEKNQKLIAENTELREKNLTQGLTIAHNRDNIQFALNVRQSSDTCLIGTLAKYLKRNGCDVGQNRLFQWMRDNGYLCSTKGERWNLPTQMAQNTGLFGIRMNTYTKGQEERTHINHTPVLTMKGMQYFVKRLLGKEYDGSITELRAEENNDTENVQNVTCIEDLTWKD